MENDNQMENDISTLPSDRITNLPKNLLETILMNLPTRDAVRTSILSRKWRHVWAKLPQFLLDETLWENVAVEYSAKATLMKILCQILLSHDGPICKFALSNPELTSCAEIDNLIGFLAKNHLEDFTLEMWKDVYLLPYSFFSWPKLTHLKLRLCSVRNFASVGFQRLTSLKLIEVNISAETLASLIHSSPSLGSLEIVSSSEVDICIDAPNLRIFIVSGLIKSIDFVREPVLSVLSIKFDISHKLVKFVGVGDIVEFFYHLLITLETLQLSFQIVKILGVGKIHKIPTSLIHLKDLKLFNITFNCLDELSFTLCLLRSSPNLKYIDILFCNPANSVSEVATTYMEGEDCSDVSLIALREVKLDSVTGTKPELKFIGLLVANSSSLKKMAIKPQNGVVNNGFEILKEVTKFSRISKEAEILFVE